MLNFGWFPSDKSEEKMLEGILFKMKHSLFNSFVWKFLLFYLKSIRADFGRFVVVSDFNSAIQFHPRIQSAPEPSSRTEVVTELATKKQICRDIFDNYKFARYEEYPYLKSPDLISRLLRLKYRENYSSKTIEVFTYGKPAYVSENVFVCLTRQKFKIRTYFVSEEYNLVRDDLGSSNYIAGRFVFGHSGDKITLSYLAEEPAKVLLADDNIEDVYLRRRTLSDISRSSIENNPLCTLKMGEKVRICVSTFNSSYFDDKVEYPPSKVHVVEGTCEEKVLSFRTGLGQKKAAGRKLKEWVMNCKVRDSEVRLDYLVSHAYRANEVFVYFWENDKEQMFLENLSTNIRLNYENNKFPSIPE